MCIIIRSSKGFTELDDELLNEAFYRNPHGIGYMYYDENQGLVAHKGLYSLKEMKRLVRYELPDDRPVYLHLRKATSGVVSKQQAHPYKIHNGLAIMHNGVLHNYSPTTSKINNTVDHKGKTQPSAPKKGGSNANVRTKPSSPSKGSGNRKKSKKKTNTNNRKTEKNDTLNFIEQYMRPALETDPHIWLNSTFIDKTESTIGIGNKLVFMDDFGNEIIYNEDQWVEYEGMLFSNKYAWPYWERTYPTGHQTFYPYNRKSKYKGGAMDYLDPTYDAFAETSYREELTGEPNFNNGLFEPYSGMPSTIRDIDDLRNLSWEEIYGIVSNEPQTASDIIWYSVMGYGILSTA